MNFESIFNEAVTAAVLAIAAEIERRHSVTVT